MRLRISNCPNDDESLSTGEDYNLISVLQAKSHADPYRDGSELYMVVPRIEKGSLLLRQQEQHIMPPTQPPPGCPPFHICSDILLSDIETQDQDCDASNTKFAGHLNPIDCRNWCKLIQCRYCFTEF